MILPIGDAPNPRGFLPWVNWLLIAANVLVYVLVNLPLGALPADPADPAIREYLRVLVERFPATPASELLASLSAFDAAVFAWGYKPGAPEIGDLFASLFLHAGFAHLAGNMLFLWIYGDNVEHQLGRLGYIAAYLGSGVAATLAFGVFAGGSLVPLVGASGAISGVLGLYFVHFPRNVVKLFVAFFPFLVDVVLVPAPLVLGFYVLADNLLPLLLSSGSNVAYGAHLGGFLAGVLLGVVRVRGLPGLGRGAPAPVDALSAARELERQGRPDEALQVLRRALRAAPAEASGPLHLAAGELLARHGHTSLAFQHLLHARTLPETRAQADRALASLGLDPRLARRLQL